MGEISVALKKTVGGQSPEGNTASDPFSVVRMVECL